MSIKPLVSIIIPVYNGSNYVREAIDSALAQTYTNKEIIVVNDGSSDDGETEKIILSYGNKVRYIYKTNGGVSSALNRGIVEMKGDYFSWLSHDDIYAPEKIQRQVQALDEATDKNMLVTCGVKCIGSEGRKIEKNYRKNPLPGEYEWHDALNFMLKYGSYNGCSLLIPKKAFEKAGLFDENLKFCQDVLMWMNIFLEQFGLIAIDDVLVSNRIHKGQLTQKGRKVFHKDSDQISQLITPRLSDCGIYANKLIFSYAYHNAILGNISVVRRCEKCSKEKRLMSFSQRVKILIAQGYGIIRPFIRKIYYMLIFRTKGK